MTSQPYRTSRRLGDVLRARFRRDPSLSLESARAELVRETVTGDATVSDDLPRGFRLTRGHRDVYYVEAGKDFCRNADEFWFTPWGGGGRPPVRVTAPQPLVADPHHPESPSKAPEVAPIVTAPTKPLSEMILSERVAATAVWLAPQLTEDSKREDFRDVCMAKFNLSPSAYDKRAWPAARAIRGWKPQAPPGAKPQVKRPTKT